MTERLHALKRAHSIEFVANKLPKCPHCGDDFDISGEEAWSLYDENDRHNVDCPSCGLDYTISSIATWTFSTDEQEDN